MSLVTQRNVGIDSGRSISRNDAREYGYDCEQHDDDSKRDRISRLYVKDEARHHAPEYKSYRDANGEPD